MWLLHAPSWLKQGHTELHILNCHSWFKSYVSEWIRIAVARAKERILRAIEIDKVCAALCETISHLGACNSHMTITSVIWCAYLLLTLLASCTKHSQRFCTIQMWSDSSSDCTVESSCLPRHTVINYGVLNWWMVEWVGECECDWMGEWVTESVCVTIAGWSVSCNDPDTDLEEWDREWVCELVSDWSVTLL